MSNNDKIINFPGAGINTKEKARKLAQQNARRHLDLPPATITGWFGMDFQYFVGTPIHIAPYGVYKIDSITQDGEVLKVTFRLTTQKPPDTVA